VEGFQRDDRLELVRCELGCITHQERNSVDSVLESLPCPCTIDTHRESSDLILVELGAFIDLQQEMISLEVFVFAAKLVLAQRKIDSRLRGILDCDVRGLAALYDFRL
jgi:hypothetical protein